MATGIKLTIASVIYILVVMVIFAYVPVGGYAVENGSVISLTSSFDAEQAYTVAENVALLGVLGGLLTFSIGGLPWWVSIIAVYIPLTTLGIGIYGIIRGI